MQTDFRGWIKTKTGVELAKKLNVPVDTVYSWAHRNVIPRNVWPDLILAYSEVGLNDLMSMERVSSVSVAG